MDTAAWGFWWRVFTGGVQIDAGFLDAELGAAFFAPRPATLQRRRMAADGVEAQETAKRDCFFIYMVNGRYNRLQTAYIRRLEEKAGPMRRGWRRCRRRRLVDGEKIFPVARFSSLP